MSRFVKVSQQSSLGKAFFEGQQVDLLSWLCFAKCLLLQFFAFCLHCSFKNFNVLRAIVLFSTLSSFN